MTDVPLFGDYDEAQPEPEKLSAGRRRTLRQADMVQRGVHPLTRLPLHEQATEVPKGTRAAPFTCGSCVHRVIVSRGAKDYPKCDVDNGAVASHSEATDVRAWWPACTRYVARTPTPEH